MRQLAQIDRLAAVLAHAVGVGTRLHQQLRDQMRKPVHITSQLPQTGDRKSGFILPQ